MTKLCRCLPIKSFCGRLLKLIELNLEAIAYSTIDIKEVAIPTRTREKAFRDFTFATRSVAHTPYLQYLNDFDVYIALLVNYS